MEWFEQLRQCLSRYYVSSHPDDVVGYLQGSASPEVWRRMAEGQGRNQMLVLGNIPPSAQEWQAAGVGHRGEVQAITIGQLGGWIVLYGGFMLRPWGQLFQISDDALTLGFPGSLRSWRANAPK